MKKTEDRRIELRKEHHMIKELDYCTGIKFRDISHII